MVLNAYKAKLPDYLDRYIYQVLKARFDRVGKNFIAKDWNMQQTLGYLGTYFPRSYAEAYCIFSDFFARNVTAWDGKEELRVFDLGCGCGGELIGLLDAVFTQLPRVKRVVVRAIDGNPYGVTFCHSILGCYGSDRAIDYEIMCQSFARLDQFQLCANYVDAGCDIILSFKALSEILSSGSWGFVNPYEVFRDTFVQKLGERGVLCVADLSTTVDLMECSIQNAASMSCGMNAFGRCQVKQMADYLCQASGNDRASCVGDCLLGGRAECHNGMMMPEQRRCGISLANVYYRDLMRQAFFVPWLDSLHNNFNANRLGADNEKTFYVDHSQTLGDEEGLFWVISLTKHVVTNANVPLLGGTAEVMKTWSF